MSPVLHGRVQGGRIVVDDSMDLPEGSEVQLRLVAAEDDLDDEDRARLHAAIETGREQIRRGEAIPAEEVSRSLWKAHGR